MPLGGLLETVMTLLNFLLPESFMGFETQPIIYFVVFILFVYLAYRFLQLALKSVLIFAAAALFPIVANKFLGMSIPLNVGNVFSYATTGLFLYLLGRLLRTFSNILKAVTWPFRELLGGSEEEYEELKEEEREEEV